MSTVIASSVLANGLRTEFADAFDRIRRRQADSRLSIFMDVIAATNRQHEFAYFDSAPHMEFWRQGDSIPTGAMDSVQWAVQVHNYAKRIPWHKNDRKDDQTQSLMSMARMAGESAALIEENLAIATITGTANNYLPAVPLAPDGAAMFAASRFGRSGGNVVTGTGVATSAAILADYYTAVEEMMQFQDGQGQPMNLAERLTAGVLIVHGAGNTQAFETAFQQQRQGLVYGANTAAATPSNIILDSSRNVQLWGTPRITDNDWYIFLVDAPLKPLFALDREGLLEFSSLEGESNGDHTRTTGEEYIQFERRVGIGIAPPYSAIKINN